MYYIQSEKDLSNMENFVHQIFISLPKDLVTWEAAIERF